MNQNTKVNNRLTKRLLFYILLCSTTVSVCSTFVQLYSSFKYDLTILEQRFDNIEKSYLPVITSGLWNFNTALVEEQIQGIVALPDIGYVILENDFNFQTQFGNADLVAKKSAEYKIEYQGRYIGTLQVFANYQDIYPRLWQQAGFILTTEFFKIFVITFCIITIFNKLIIQHIYKISQYTQELSSDNLDEKLVLIKRPVKEDELDYLVYAINTMRIKLKHEISKLEEAENAVRMLNSELEVKIHDRTAKLEKSNQQLQDSFNNLTLAQDQLVQSEKMASLGQLVAGVAHEVNTPLGICVTSVSALKDKVEALQQAVESQALTKSFLTNSLNLLVEYEQIIERSLRKAVELIRSFKSIAVEQHTDNKVNINLHQHVYDVVNTVKTLFKQKNYQLNIEVDKDIFVETYPSAWNQILTNFLMNSHIHGFEDQRDGNISIIFEKSEAYLTLLYSDDGKGIPAGLKKRIFDPFVTTKRGQGGSGLGLNIVFNLVHTKLSGTIELLESEQGVCFKVQIPLLFV